MLYLNHAATSLRKPECVAAAMLAALNYGSAARGVSEASLSMARQITTLRTTLADFFGFSQPERVIFTKNVTEALNLVLFGLLSPGDHVIATDLDHNAVLRPLYLLEKQGVAVDFAAADRQGCISYDALDALFRPNTRALVCTHASNLTGNVLDIGIMSAMAHKHGALFILDAAQTAGERPIHMEKEGIDVLCFTGHKALMGPQGTGGLLLSPAVSLRPLISGGTGILSFEKEQPAAYPEHLEAGTLNGPGLCGLLAAVQFLQESGVETVQQRLQALTADFYAGVRDIPGITVYGDFRGYPTLADHGPIVTLNLAGISSAELADLLASHYGIEVRAGGHCAPRMHEALGTRETGAVRFSFGFFTEDSEIQTAVQALREISAMVSA